MTYFGSNVDSEIASIEAELKTIKIMIFVLVSSVLGMLGYYALQTGLV